MLKIKRFLKSIWNEFIYGGHLLSLGFSGIVFSTSILLNKKIEWQIMLVAYLLSQLGYTYNHFKEAKKDSKTNPERAKYFQKSTKYFLFSATVYVLIFILLLVYFSTLKFFFFSFFILIIGILYTEFFKGFTRKIIGFKNIYVSFCWALGGAFLPLFYYLISFNLFFLIFFLFIFLRLIIDTTFFDLKDVKSDKEEKLLTIPVVFGIDNSLKILQILNILSLFPIFLGVYFKIIPYFSLGLIFLFFYSLYYLKKAKKIDEKNLRQLSYIIVDGQYVLWPLILLLTKSLLKL